MMTAAEEDPCTYRSARTAFNIIFLIADLFGITVFCLLLAWILKYNGGFSWSTSTGLLNYHIILMSFFLVFLTGNASLIFRLFPGNPKYFNKVFHASLQFLALVGMTFGLVAILRHHELTGPDFKSLHSWIGIVAIAGYYIQWLLGFFTFLYQCTSLETKIRFLPVHKLVGRSLFIFSVTAAATGLMQEAVYSGSAVPSPPAMMLNFAGLFATVFVVSIIYLLYDHLFRRRAAPVSSYAIASSSSGQKVFYGSTSRDTVEKVVY